MNWRLATKIDGCANVVPMTSTHAYWNNLDIEVICYPRFRFPK